MLTVPIELRHLIVRVAPLFSERVWEHAQVLVGGAILAPGNRPATAARRVRGVREEEHFQNYHRVLNRAVWSALAASRIWLGLVVRALVPCGVLGFGLDDTSERRRGEVCTDTAVWYHRAMPPVPSRWVLIRDPQGEFKPQAVLAPTLPHTPHPIPEWFIGRWTMEVTFAEARAHLGLETQRQWNDLAIARTTPTSLGLYSLVTLLASQLSRTGTTVVRPAAWYAKEPPTSSDTSAVGRRHSWSQCHFSMSAPDNDVIKIPRALFDRLTDTVCSAA